VFWTSVQRLIIGFSPICSIELLEPIICEVLFVFSRCALIGSYTSNERASKLKLLLLANAVVLFIDGYVLIVM
jgi:hypothetical protein